MNVILQRTPDAQLLPPDEFLSRVNGIPVAVQVNLILIPCFSGVYRAFGDYLNSEKHLLSTPVPRKPLLLLLLLLTL